MFPEGRLFEFLIVGAVALVVVGPKDLPMLLRKVGQFVGKIRGMAAEFRASFDEMARQSELDELRKEVQALRTARPMDYVSSKLGSDDVMHEINADLAAANAAITARASFAPPPEPQLHMPELPAAPEPTSPPEPAPPAPEPSGSGHQAAAE
jgi:sec-independent protein translocase protein TatB